MKYTLESKINAALAGNYIFVIDRWDDGEISHDRTVCVGRNEHGYTYSECFTVFGIEAMYSYNGYMSPAEFIELIEDLSKQEKSVLE